MKNTLLVCFLLLCETGFCQVGHVFGEVTFVDHSVTEIVPFANISFRNTRIGSSANLEGEFSLDSIPYGTYDIIASHISYGWMTTEIEINHKLFELNFEFNNRFNRPKNDSVCPICGKTDRVRHRYWDDEIRPYFTGDTVIMKNTSGDSSCYHRMHLIAPCCTPWWHCNRDATDF